MSAVAKIVVDEGEVHARLAELKFPPVEDFHSALLESNLARSTCTKLDPPTFRGTTTWAVAVRAFRRQSLPDGWKPNDKHGFSRTVTPDGARAIVVATGTSGTGRAKGSPKTKSKKGPKALEAINARAIQLGLIELLGPEPEKQPDPEIWFWLLRHARTTAGKKRVYSEVSRPSSIGTEGRVIGWSERIILPRLDIDGDGGSLRVPEPGPQFDVDVVRRAL